jgi:hypothetical protein
VGVASAQETERRTACGALGGDASRGYSWRWRFLVSAAAEAFDAPEARRQPSLANSMSVAPPSTTASRSATSFASFAKPTI